MRGRGGLGPVGEVQVHQVVSGRARDAGEHVPPAVVVDDRRVLEPGDVVGRVRLRGHQRAAGAPAVAAGQRGGIVRVPRGRIGRTARAAVDAVRGGEADAVRVAAVPPSAVSADWKAGFLLPLRSNSSGFSPARQESLSRMPQTVMPVQRDTFMQALHRVRVRGRRGLRDVQFGDLYVHAERGEVRQRGLEAGRRPAGTEVGLEADAVDGYAACLEVAHHAVDALGLGGVPVLDVVVVVAELGGGVGRPSGAEGLLDEAVAQQVLEHRAAGAGRCRRRRRPRSPRPRSGSCPCSGSSPW